MKFKEGDLIQGGSSQARVIAVEGNYYKLFWIRANKYSPHMNPLMATLFEDLIQFKLWPASIIEEFYEKV